MTYPETLRHELEPLRAQRVPFAEAWDRVIAAHPPHRCDPFYVRGSELLRQTKEWFRRAYLGYGLPGPHYTVLQDALIEAAKESANRSLPEDPRGRLRSIAPGRCRFGGPHCSEDAAEGERFCGEHLALLHGMRETGSAWGQAREAA